VPSTGSLIKKNMQNLFIKGIFILFFNISFSQQLKPNFLETVGIDSKRFERVLDQLENLSKERKVPGTVTLIYKDNQLILNQANGFKDLEKKIPMNSDDIFRIASQTKLVISVGIMILQEEGKLLITDKLSKYIPEFKDSKVAEFKDGGGFTEVKAKNEITIKNLLTHTAGIGYGMGIGAEKWKESNVQGFYFAHLDEPILQTVKKMASLPQEAHPGTKFTYGYNYDILGAVIEVVSGQSLDKFLKEKIFDPLDMIDTSFYLPKEKLSRLTTVYIYDSENDSIYRAPEEGTYNSQGHYYKGPRKSFSGGAGLLSTSSDYGNFLLMILNQGQYKDQKILSRKSVELITRDNLNGVNYPWGDGWSFGLGVAVTLDSGAMSLIGSDGQIIGGGAYRTEFWVDPKENLVVLFLTQLRDENYELKYHEKIRALIYQSLN